MVELLLIFLVIYIIMRFRENIAIALAFIVGWAGLAFWWGVLIGLFVWLGYRAKEEERESISRSTGKDQK
jgi:hypothetical protein